MRAELTIEITRTPEDVFAYLIDVSNLPARQVGVKSATLRDGRVEESRSLLGRELHTALEIVEQEEPRLFTLRALDSPVPFSVRHELEPSAGGTRLRVTAQGDALPQKGEAAEESTGNSESRLHIRVAVRPRFLYSWATSGKDRSERGTGRCRPTIAAEGAKLGYSLAEWRHPSSLSCWE